MLVLKSFLRHNQFLQPNQKMSFPAGSTTAATAGKRLSIPLLETIVPATWVRVDVTCSIAVQTISGREILELEVGADANDSPLLETIVVATSVRVDVTCSIAVQTISGREILQHAVGADANNSPLLETIVPATWIRVDVTCSIAVQTISGREVFVRLYCCSNGCHSDRQDGHDSGRPTDGKAPFQFVHSSLFKVYGDLS